MKNRYKGWCVKCQKMVQAGEGEAIKRQGAWFAIHVGCQNLEKELEERAARPPSIYDDIQYVECVDDSQMRLRFERTRHGW